MTMRTYVMVRKSDRTVMGLMTTSTKEQAEAAAARRWTLTGQKFQAIAWDKATAEQKQAATAARIASDEAEHEARVRAAQEHCTCFVHAPDDTLGCALHAASGCGPCSRAQGRDTTYDD